MHRTKIYLLLKMKKKKMMKIILNFLLKKKLSPKIKPEVLELLSVLKFMANSIKNLLLNLNLSKNPKNKKKELELDFLKLSCSLLLMIKNKISSSTPWKKKLSSILIYSSLFLTIPL